MTEPRVHAELVAYSTQNGYVAEHFASPVCSECATATFRLAFDETEGVAIRACSSCGAEHEMGDSAEFLDAVDELTIAQCPCGGEAFAILTGVALYPKSEDVRWIYLGCRCVACDLSGIYADWKNEYIGFRSLLANM